MRRALLLALTTAAVVGSASPAPAAWQAPVQLSHDADDSVLTASVATDGTARLAFANFTEPSRVRVATAPPDGPLGPERKLLTLTTGDQNPRVAFDRAGRAIVVFERKPKPSPWFRARAALQRPDGSFGAPVTISRPGRTARLPDVRANTAGDAIAAWEWHGGARGGWHVQLALRRAGRRFGRPVTLPHGDRSAAHEQIAINASGQILVAFTVAHRMWAASGTVATGIGRVQDLGAAGDGGHAIGLDDAGRAVVVWDPSTVKSPNPALVAVTGTVPRGFAAAQTLAAPRAAKVERDASGPEAAVTSDGTALAVWVDFSGRLVAFAAAPGQPFGTPQVLSIGREAEMPALAAGPDGTAVATWTEPSRVKFPSSTTEAVLHGAVRPPGGPFGAAEAVSEPRRLAYWPVVAAGAGGVAVTGWSRSPEGAANGFTEGALLRP